MTVEVAVTGMGFVGPTGIGACAFEQAMLAGVTGVKPRDGDEAGLRLWAPLPDIPLPEAVRKTAGDSTLAGRLLEWIGRASPAVQATALAAAEARLQAGSRAAPCRTGLIVAGSNLDNREAMTQHERRLAGRPVRPSHAAQYLDSYCVGLLGALFDIRAEGYTAGGASASGGVAIALARRALLSGDLDAVLVVGPPTMLSAVEVEAMASIGALRRHGDPPYQPFQAPGSGFVYGQGAAALMLEAADGDDDRRILAWMPAASLHLGGGRSTNPDFGGEVAAMRRALHQAGLEPRQVMVVNAHATGTPAGDAAEAEAIMTVFGKDRPSVTATKAFTGHCLCSAGLVEAVACVLQIRGGFIHPNPFLTAPVDPRLSFSATVADRIGVTSVMSNSFGFGGIGTSQIFTKRRRRA